MGIFDGSIGAFVAGTLLSVFLCGLTTNQAFTYYTLFGMSDRWQYLYMVTGLLVLSWAHTIFSCMTIYIWTVTDYGQIAKLATSPWTFAVDPALTGIAASVVQFFYAYRVYVVSKRQSVVFPILICVFSAIQLAFACASTGMIFKLEEFSRFQVFTYGVSIWLGSAALCDVLITGCLVWNLHKYRSGFLQTNSVINRLIELVIQTNGLTAAVSIIDAVLFGVLSSSYHVTANLTLVKLYFNSLLVSLNARKELQREFMNSPPLYNHPHEEPSPSAPSSFGGVFSRESISRPAALQVQVSTMTERSVSEMMDHDEYERYGQTTDRPRRGSRQMSGLSRSETVTEKLEEEAGSVV